MKRRIFVFLLVMGLAVGTASAQFGGVVYDPTNYHNALLRYYQLQQHLVQLQQTYSKVLAHYNLAMQMARSIENMPARYRALFSQWRNGSALNTFGNTGGWITGVNTGTVGGGYQQATTQLSLYDTGHISSMDRDELSRVQSQYASVQLADGASTAAHGHHRRHPRQRLERRSADGESRERLASRMIPISTAKSPSSTRSTPPMS